MWSSNTTTGNDTRDSCILDLSPDNSQSPDGPILPKYHSTPIPVSDLNMNIMSGDLNIMSGGSSILSIPSLPKFETDSSESSDEFTTSKEVSPSGSAEDLRFNTPIKIIDSSDSDTHSKDVSPLGSRSDLNLETAIFPKLNSIPVPASIQEEF